MPVATGPTSPAATATMASSSFAVPALLEQRPAAAEPSVGPGCLAAHQQAEREPERAPGSLGRVTGPEVCGAGGLPRGRALLVPAGEVGAHGESLPVLRSPSVQRGALQRLVAERPPTRPVVPTAALERRLHGASLRRNGTVRKRAASPVAQPPGQRRTLTSGAVRPCRS